MPPAAIVHLHLHQPPREDPWLGHLPREVEAAPDHDVYARAERTCYRALAAARVTDADGRVRRVVDTLARTSFDVAPTLLAWLARHAPATYDAILAADRTSADRLGRGNAIAHPYHHVVLPLLSRRDKVTEVRWGLDDFARHFGRPAEGMWLPETAVDDETLDVLAQEGVQFTLLAPHQFDGLPAAGRPGLYRSDAGREIALCTYDAEIAHDVAFGALLRDGIAWAARMQARLDEYAHAMHAAATAAVATAAAATTTPDAGSAIETLPSASPPMAAARGATASTASPIVAVAANAETFGQHHRFGDMALAAALDALEHPGVGADGLRRAPTPLSNYAAVLVAEPAVDEVGIHDRSAWSCPHALARWERDCGCRRDPSTAQAWRAPLVAALTELRGALDERFADEGGTLFGYAPGGADAVRDAYNRSLPDARDRGDTLDLAGGCVPDTSDPVWARELLEMSREALAMFDADGIGADELSDLAVQTILARAARAAMLAGPRRDAVLERLRGALSVAVGAHTTPGSARAILQRFALTDPPLAVRVAAGVAAVAFVNAPPCTPPAWDAVIDTTAAGSPVVHVADRRLGAGGTYAVVVDVPSPMVVSGRAYRLADVDPRGVTVLVRPVPGAPGARPAFTEALGAALKLADLPEPMRACVELALRRAVVQRLLDATDRERLAAGEAKLRDLASAALVRAIDALGVVIRDSGGERGELGPRAPIAAASAPAVARVLGLADLAESAGAGTPFDAQTALYRIGRSLPLAAREQLAPVAWRLGFSARGWRELDEAG